jgi:hypothetical protein
MVTLNIMSEFKSSARLSGSVLFIEVDYKQTGTHSNITAVYYCRSGINGSPTKRFRSLKFVHMPANA